MLNLSSTAKYGLRGLLYLARNRDEGFIKIDRIAREEDIPENYLRKIFQRLTKHGIVDSTVGPTGGVRLSEASGEITLAHAIEVIDGKPAFGGCTLFGYPACPGLEQCPIRQSCDIYKQNLWKKLEQFNLSDL